MLNFIADKKGLSREDVCMMLSAAMGLVVTKAADGVKVIHALVPKRDIAEAIERDPECSVGR